MPKQDDATLEDLRSYVDDLLEYRQEISAVFDEFGEDLDISPSEDPVPGGGE